jgi:rhomboid protease GluP
MAEDPRRMCPHCRAFITTKDKVCPYCHEQVGPRAYRQDPTGLLAGFIPHARYTTVLILFINLAFYLATSLYSAKTGAGNFMNIDIDTLIGFGGAARQLVLGFGQWWRLVTAGFLHGGLVHILMNSWAMFDVGAQVDETFGTARMLVIYFISTITGFLASVFLEPYLAVGASAALCGLIGAMVAAGMHDRSAMGAMIRGSYLRWFIWIMVISFIPGLGIAWAAHLGGFVGGFAIAWVAGGNIRYAGPWTNRLWQLCAVFCVILTACCFLKMYLSFTQFGG